MRDSSHVEQVLEGLRAYYARDGKKVVLNEVQIAVYLDGLAEFTAADLNAAAQQHMRKSEFFPKLSELLAILQPKVDTAAAAQLAWTTVERAIRRAGAYRGVVFANGAIGETVRQVFGSWPFACSFELDSPGWAIRRQSFLAIYPAMEKRNLTAVTLRGMHESEQPLMIPPVPGLPYCMGVKKLPIVDDAPLTKTESVEALAEIQRRWIEGGSVRSK